MENFEYKKKGNETDKKEYEILLKFDNNTKIISENRRVGPIIFGSCNNESFLIVTQETMNGYKSLKASEEGVVVASVDYSVWQNRMNPCQLLYRSNDNKTGILNTNLEIILPAFYECLREMDSRYFEVLDAGRRGIMNEAFEIIVPIDYHEIAYDFKHSRFFCRKALGHDWYDQQGNFIMHLPYYKIVVYENEGDTYLMVNKRELEAYQQDDDDPYFWGEEDHNYGVWGLLNNDGSIAIPVQYWKLYGFRNHVILIKCDKPELEYPSYDSPSVESYYEYTGEQYGLSDFNHNILVPFEYTDIMPTWYKDLFLVNKDGKRCYLRQWQDDHGTPYSEGGLWGLVNSKNEILVPVIYNCTALYDHKVLFQHNPTGEFDHNADSFAFHFE